MAPYLIECEEVFAHGLTVTLVLVPLLYEVTDELISMAFVYFFLEGMQLVFSGGLGQVLVPPEPRHHRGEGLLLIVQILAEVHHLVLKLDQSLLVQLAVG